MKTFPQMEPNSRNLLSGLKADVTKKFTVEPLNVPTAGEEREGRSLGTGEHIFGVWVITAHLGMQGKRGRVGL